MYDWDQVGSDEFIGEGIIPFTGEDLESFAAKEFQIKLNDSNGTLRVRLLWQPQLLARKRTGTSLFSAATTRIFTSAPGTAIGAGIDAGGKVLGAGFDALESGFRGFGILGGNNKKEDVAVVSSTSSSGISITAPRFSISSISIPSMKNDDASIQNDGRWKKSIVDIVCMSFSNDLSLSFYYALADFANKVIQVDLLGARNLKAMDRGGTSDPCKQRLK